MKRTTTYIATAYGDSQEEMEQIALEAARTFFPAGVGLEVGNYTARRAIPGDHGKTRWADVPVHGTWDAPDTGPLELWADLPWYGRASLVFSALCVVAIAVMVTLAAAT